MKLRVRAFQKLTLFALLMISCKEAKYMY